MIKVGEYVRIDNDFRLIALGIGEVIRINQDTIYVKTNFELPFAFKIENIAKHSKNLIDLIEVGDYVNGIPIEDIEEIDNKKVFYSNGEMIAWTNRDKGIETILTKEQYIQNCYKCQDIENGTI